MKIILHDGTIIKCWKIEPSLKQGYIVINEEHGIPLANIICIVKED